MKDAAERGERGVVACERDQRHAERRAVPAHRRRHGERAEIEQVDEIGIGAKPAVEPDRVGHDLLDVIDGGHGRQQQRVDLAKDVIAHAAQFLELIEGGERIDGGRARAAEEDLPGDRVQGLV